MRRKRTIKVGDEIVMDFVPSNYRTLLINSTFNGTFYKGGHTVFSDFLIVTDKNSRLSSITRTGRVEYIIRKTEEFYVYVDVYFTDNEGGRKLVDTIKTLRKSIVGICM